MLNFCPPVVNYQGLAKASLSINRLSHLASTPNILKLGWGWATLEEILTAYKLLNYSLGVKIVILISAFCCFEFVWYVSHICPVKFKRKIHEIGGGQLAKGVSQIWDLKNTSFQPRQVVPFFPQLSYMSALYDPFFIASIKQQLYWVILRRYACMYVCIQSSQTLVIP